MKGVLHLVHVNFHIPIKAKNFQDKKRKVLLQKRRWAVTLDSGMGQSSSH